MKMAQRIVQQKTTMPNEELARLHAQDMKYKAALTADHSIKIDKVVSQQKMKFQVSGQILPEIMQKPASSPKKQKNFGKTKGSTNFPKL